MLDKNETKSMIGRMERIPQENDTLIHRFEAIKLVADAVTKPFRWLEDMLNQLEAGMGMSAGYGEPTGLSSEPQQPVRK